MPQWYRLLEAISPLLLIPFFIMLVKFRHYVARWWMRKELGIDPGPVTYGKLASTPQERMKALLKALKTLR